MRDFPSCFEESGAQIAYAASSSSSAGKGAAHNLVTCLYQTQLAAWPYVISVTWSKSLMGQGLSVAVDGLKEHIYGKKIYSAKAQFCDNGQFHDLVIECDTVGLKDPCLEIRIDKKPVMQVKRLAWKFRGNQTILADGLPVEVFWDVHSWLFGSTTTSNAVFMFQTCQAPEKSMPWSYSQIFRESQLQGLGFSLILYAWKIE
ncbi:hypothetical protein ZWY2020_005846 [Hordeum vulgare]|nr:hypothetical protein ZWY2020_005846 [Hordeum vulgare]